MLNEQRKNSKSGKVEDSEPLLDWESYYILVGEVWLMIILYGCFYHRNHESPSDQINLHIAYF